MYFIGLSVCVIMLAVAWALVWHDGDRYPGPLVLLALGVGMGLGSL